MREACYKCFPQITSLKPHKDKEASTIIHPISQMKALTLGGHTSNQGQGWMANTKVSALKPYVPFFLISRYQLDIS